MPEYRIILPILNKNAELFGEPAFYLDEKSFVDTIYIEDFGAFFSEVASSYVDGVSKNTQCIYIEGIESEMPSTELFVEIASAIGIKAKYALNFFSQDCPILFPFAVLLSKGDSKKSSTILDIADIEGIAGLHKLRQGDFKIATDRESFAEFMKIVGVACQKHSPTLFTLARFSSCLTRFDEIDRIVDACVSLESLIQGNQEISFRLSLYLAIIAEADKAKRQNAYTSFKNLYNARSSIVHGDLRKKDIDKVKNEWEETRSYAFSAINYYLAYLFENDPGGWDQHLLGLALGSQERIVD